MLIFANPDKIVFVFFIIIMFLLHNILIKDVDKVLKITYFLYTLHTTYEQSGIDATSFRRIDVRTTSFWRHVPTGRLSPVIDPPW